MIFPKWLSSKRILCFLVDTRNFWIRCHHLMKRASSSTRRNELHWIIIGLDVCISSFNVAHNCRTSIFLLIGFTARCVHTVNRCSANTERCFNRSTSRTLTKWMSWVFVVMGCLLNGFCSSGFSFQCRRPKSVCHLWIKRDKVHVTCMDQSWQWLLKAEYLSITVLSVYVCVDASMCRITYCHVHIGTVWNTLQKVICTNLKNKRLPISWLVRDNL